MKPNEAKELLPEDVRKKLKAVDRKHWEEFAMVYLFHKRNINFESKHREILTQKGNSPGWITSWLDHTEFGSSEKNIRILTAYVYSLRHKELMDIDVDKILNGIIEYYETL